MANPLDLENSRFLVTGAASGIGRATCILLSRLAGRIIAADIDAEGLEGTRKLLEGDGHICKSFDFREIERIPAWVNVLASEGGIVGYCSCCRRSLHTAGASFDSCCLSQRPYNTPGGCAILGSRFLT